MKRDMFRTYSWMDSAKPFGELDADIGYMYVRNIQFEEHHFENHVELVAFGVEEGSENDMILKKRGFDTKGV